MVTISFKEFRTNALKSFDLIKKEDNDMSEAELERWIRRQYNRYHVKEETMTFEILKEKVAGAIDRNDVWDAVKMVAEYTGVTESFMNNIERWEGQYLREGHLTSIVKFNRDVIIGDLRHAVGQEAFNELRI